jgi:hypothetical protein
MANLNSSDEPAPDTPPEDNPDEADAEPLATDQPVEEELITRGRDAGFRPLRVLAATYIRQGLDVFDGVLGAFDSPSKGKKK